MAGILAQLLVCIFCLFGLLWCDYDYDKGRWNPPPRWKNMKSLSRALEMYWVDYNGFAPYSAKGEEYALYLLKPYVMREGAKLDAPDAETDLTGPVEWVDEDRRVIGSDYEYLNRPGLKLDRSGDVDVVVLAEKEYVDVNFRYVLLAPGVVIGMHSTRGRVVGSKWESPDP